jgi:RNA polymerase sigma-70 factor (ECF subfamily)
MTPTPGVANSELIARARERRPEALEALYLEHGDALMRLAYHLTGSAADAEDVLHDVFLGLPEALDRYEERGTLAAWLRRVTTRVALDRLRAIRRRREVRLEPATEPATRPPDAAAAGRFDLARALRALPETLRVVFVLKEIEGQSHAEIARSLGIRVGTSEVRLHRAVRLLRRALREKP